MKKYLATLIKELLQLFRDRAGMAILFLMPMALILIMVVVQDVPFRDFQEKKIPLLIYDADGDSLGAALVSGIKANPVFDVTLVHKKEIAIPALQEEVQAGKYKVGIIIPKGSTESLRRRMHGFVKLALNGNQPPLPEMLESDSSVVALVFDPVIKQSFRGTVVSSLEKHLARIELKTMLELFQGEIKELLPELNELSLSSKPMIYLADSTSSSAGPDGTEGFNSVQHNVPAYTVFGIFFIVITMASNIIREREDGSDLRLQLIPGTFWPARLGRITAYLSVTILQAILMLCVGFTLLPWMGYPSLIPGNSILALFILIAATGLAACGFGLTVGTVFNTHQQSAVFGAVSVVIMSALGGVWVPIFVMPEAVQQISSLLPVGWALESFNELFLRDGDLENITGNVAKLILFFLANMVITQMVEKYRRFIS